MDENKSTNVNNNKKRIKTNTRKLNNKGILHKTYK